MLLSFVMLYNENFACGKCKQKKTSETSVQKYFTQMLIRDFHATVFFISEIKLS